MIVKIKFIGVTDIDIPSEMSLEKDATVADVVNYLERVNGSPVDGLTILVNKEKTSLDTKLQEDDQILILQVLGGG
ncbi:MoaD/ThiS family protein [Gudongella sp. DL1XJH-153]|uniref:MoaD/ThiS family protein n=1 Tax=Gudongella sp. DL1XJH-153 TaxID=3409804 RepID=UPI003BB6BAF9